MNPLRNAIQLIRRRYLPSFLAMNVLFYCCIALGMGISVANPQLQATLANSTSQGLQSPAWSPIVGAYKGGHVVRAAIITFAVNFFLAAVLFITIPSMFIPFLGIFLAIIRALLWGIIFGPGPHGFFSTLRFHWPVMLMEGQGYVLAMLAVYVHGKALIRPASVSATGFGDGYVRGLLASLQLYPLIALVLAVSAIYEACEVIWVHRY